MARSETVRAVVLMKPKTLEAREFPRPAIGADDALLRIEACGICDSDYEQYEGAQPQHEDHTPYPVIPGPEPLGVIEEVGRQAAARWGVSEGDRVAVRSGYGCGHCEACRRWEPPRVPGAAAPTATPTSASRRISGAATPSGCTCRRTR